MDKRRLSAELIRRDSGIVVGWLLKVAITLIIIGILLFEVVGVVLVRGTAADTASKAAQEAGYTYRGSGNLESAKATAKQFAENEGTEFVSLSVNDQAKTVTVTVRKRAKTIFIQKIGPLRKFTVVEATQTSPLPT